MNYHSNNVDCRCNKWTENWIFLLKFVILISFLFVVSRIAQSLEALDIEPNLQNHRTGDQLARSWGFCMVNKWAENWMFLLIYLILISFVSTFYANHFCRTNELIRWLDKCLCETNDLKKNHIFVIFKFIFGLILSFFSRHPIFCNPWQDVIIFPETHWYQMAS